MTNTKFRRRALISSVAMLLVALVALGSATFAWFTENPVVKADGIAAYGQTSIGLKIQTTTDPGWKDAAKLMKAGSFNTDETVVLAPAYAAQAADSTLTWLNAKADAATEWTSTGNWASASGEVNDVAATGNDTLTGIYHEVIQIKATGGDSGTVNVNLTGLTLTQATGAPAIKAGVTVLVAVGGKVKAVKKLGTDPVKNYASAASSSPVGSPSGTYPNAYTSGNVLLGAAGYTDSNPLTVDVYVYLDGTDEQVFTNNVSADQLLNGVELNFAKAA